MFGFFGNNKLKQVGEKSASYLSCIVIFGPNYIDDINDMSSLMNYYDNLDKGISMINDNLHIKSFCIEHANLDNKTFTQFYNLIYKDLICLRMYVIEQIISLKFTSDKKYILSPFFDELREKYSNVIDKHLAPDPGQYLERRYTIFNQYLKEAGPINSYNPVKSMKFASDNIITNLILLGGYQAYSPFIDNMYKQEMNDVISCVNTCFNEY